MAEVNRTTGDSGAGHKRESLYEGLDSMSVEEKGKGNDLEATGHEWKVRSGGGRGGGVVVKDVEADMRSKWKRKRRRWKKAGQERMREQVPEGGRYGLSKTLINKIRLMKKKSNK